MPHENDPPLLSRIGRNIWNLPRTLYNLPSATYKHYSNISRGMSDYFAEDNRAERALIAIADIGLPIVSGLIISALAEKEPLSEEEQEEYSFFNTKNAIAFVTPIAVAGVRAMANRLLSMSMNAKITKGLAKSYLEGPTMVEKDFHWDVEQQKANYIPDVLGKYSGEFSSHAAWATGYLGHCVTDVTANFIVGSYLMGTGKTPGMIFGGGLAIAFVIGGIKSHSSVLEKERSNANDKLKAALEDMEQKRAQIIMLNAQEKVLNNIEQLVDKRAENDLLIAGLWGVTVALETAGFWAYPVAIRHMGASVFTDKQLAMPGNVDIFLLQSQFVIARSRDITDILSQEPLLSQGMGKILNAKEVIEACHTLRKEDVPFLSIQYTSNGTIELRNFSLTKSPGKKSTPSAMLKLEETKSTEDAGDIEMGKVSDSERVSLLPSTHVQEVLSEKDMPLRTRVEMALKDDNVCSLRDAELTLLPGQVYRLAGKSGLGKSNLLKSLAGIWPYAAGTVSLPCPANEICFIPQGETYMLSQATLLETMIFPRDGGSLTENDRQRLEGYMQALEMGELIPSLQSLEQKNWATMSGGQKQRVAVIRVLMVEREPKMLLMDEGTTGLDGENKDTALRLIKERFKNAVVLYVDHQPSSGFCDQVVHIDPTTRKFTQSKEVASMTTQQEAGIHVNGVVSRHSAVQQRL